MGARLAKGKQKAIPTPPEDSECGLGSEGDCEDYAVSESSDSDEEVAGRGPPDYTRWTRARMVKECAIRGLVQSGSKATVLARLVEYDAPTWHDEPFDVERPDFDGAFKIKVPKHVFVTAANLFLFLLTPALLVILVEPTNLYADQQVRD